MVYVPRTELSNPQEHEYRWNVDTTWHLYSFMIQEYEQMKESETQFEIYHHKMASLYFGFGAIESFLNAEIRIVRTIQGVDDKDILIEIRDAKDKKRWGEWIKEISGGTIEECLFEKMKYLKEIRNEITHSKRKDQLLYGFIDEYSIDEIIDIVQEIIVTIKERQNKPFPYWLIGWNYIGFNFNDKELCLSNNLNGFYYSCLNIGFSPMPPQSMFEKKIMGSYESFLKLKSAFNSSNLIIEPKNPMFDTPRLTRRWWDKDILDK